MSQPQPKNMKTAKKSEETTVAKSEKRGLESKTNAKKKILGRSVKHANAGPDGENRNGCSTAADENSLAETAGSHQERKVVLQELRIEVDASRCGNSDDNKENVSSAPSEEALDNSSHYGSEIRLLENNDNVPLKENVALKVVENIARKNGINKSELLDREADDLAVRIALGETHVIAETKKFLSRFLGKVSHRQIISSSMWQLVYCNRHHLQGWKSGAVTTLGRGGNDMTATTIGKALGPREIQVWKDVDGVLTCVPNIYPHANNVPYLTFEEATELAFLVLR
ncbi:Aspartokinase 2, chloroplastic [Zea mays]|uniref:Aspartokinase 2, chloroplastic n=1 Tax=Zea mays TaxID=4577 RepID=A0A3L6FPM2_MAIZE|nr:Aspartokinase 2, chloroplastic [Zea mays]